MSHVNADITTTDTPEMRREALRSIHDRVIALKDSPLYMFRTSKAYVPVIGEGSHFARYMFIGEAPGRNEAQKGRPFCGAAGKILDELLAHIQLKREDVYITNIVKDRPPENRDPLPSEIKFYGPFLDEQIEIIKPQVIVTLGRYSMGYIMKKFDLELQLEPISKAHGKAYITHASYGPLTIVAQYHPAAAIYTQALKDTLKKDFEILKTLDK